MPPRIRILAAATLSVFAAVPARAQFGPPPLAEDATVVAELVVRAFGGPAWWKVSDKDTTVYVLASPGQPVETWNKTLLTKRLDGAHTLITPPDVKAGLLIILALPKLKGTMNAVIKGRSDKMEGNLPPPLRARFVAARQRIGQPATRYGSLSPAVAGFALSGDAYAAMPKPPPAAKTEGAPVEATAAQEARRLKVRVMPATTYGGWQLVKVMNELDRPGLDCLAATLDDLDKAYARPPADGPSREDKALLKAWADGDVRPMLEAYRKEGDRQADLNLNSETKAGNVYLKLRAPLCLQQIPTVRTLTAQWMPNETAAIVRALKKPGKAVAVLPAADLLFKGGVFDQLRQQGFTVTPPGGAD